MQYIEQQHNIKIDALISCGDFQAIRNTSDMYSMKCKEKYLEIGNFHQYYTGQKKAPYLTIFIGGNHEASNHNRELYFGGWAAPNIYFLGGSNVITLKKGSHMIRLGGISGIYKSYDFLNSKLETFPLDSSSIVSCFHQKQIDILKLAQLNINNNSNNNNEHLDVFLSHDWPTNVVKHGNVDQLLRVKKFFANDVKNNCLGSYPLNYLLNHLKPKYWISGHLHVKYTAVYPHQNNNNQDEKTLFLALDKCLPNRDFLQIIPLGKKSWDLNNLNSQSDQPQDLQQQTQEQNNNENDNEDQDIQLIYDEQWLIIQKSVCEVFNYHLKQDFFSIDHKNEVKLKNEEIQKNIQEQMKKNQDYFKTKNLNIPQNFKITCEPYSGVNEQNKGFDKIEINNQTLEYLQLLGIDENKFTDLLHYNHEKPAYFESGVNKQKIVTYTNTFVKNNDEIDLDDFSDDDQENNNNFDNKEQQQEQLQKQQNDNQFKQDKQPEQSIKIQQNNYNSNKLEITQINKTIANNNNNNVNTKIDHSDIKLDELPFL